MPEGSSIFDIIFFAVFAAFIFYRLRGALGRRTGEEKRPHDPYSGQDNARDNAAANTGEDGNDNVIPLPQRDNPFEADADDFSDFAPEGSELSDGLKAVAGADQSFNPGSFIFGAKAAYEMIVTTFAKGDKDSLKPLLSDEVFGPFEDVIDGRSDRDETVDSDFIGIRKADIITAVMQGRIAEVTVKFVTELVQCTKNSDGNIIDGDPNSVSEVTDIWTFARDTHSDNPNWLLVATEAA